MTDTDRARPSAEMASASSKGTPMPGPRCSIRSTNGGHRILITVGGIQLETPPVQDLAFYAGLGVLAAAETIEWPVAVAAAVGQFLLRRANRPAPEEAGEAVAEGSDNFASAGGPG